MHFTGSVEDDVIAAVAAGEEIALFFQPGDKLMRIVAFGPGAEDRGHAVLLAQAGQFFLLGFSEVAPFGPFIEAVGLAVALVLHATRQFQPVIAGEVAHDGADFHAVEGNLFGAPLIGDDTGPDDVVMLAALDDMADHGARLVVELQRFLDAADEIKILLVGETVFVLPGIDGQGIEVFAGFGGLGLDFPFAERAMQVLRHRAAHIQHVDAFIVGAVQEMGGELAPAAALAGFGDHASSPSQGATPLACSSNSRRRSHW